MILIIFLLIINLIFTGSVSYYFWKNWNMTMKEINNFSKLTNNRLDLIERKINLYEAL